MPAASKRLSCCVASSSLDLSDRTALAPLGRLLAAVRAAAGETPLLLIGAAARDLLLVHTYGLDPERATEDTDVALATPSWEIFLRLRGTLIESGKFKGEQSLHRLWFGDQRLDIVPFGGVEGSDRAITWPPEGADVMNVSGLREALAASIEVRLPGHVSISVPPLPALVLLKLWAWADRKYTAPGKDASDIWAFLRHYAAAGNDERLWDEEGSALASFAFDLEKAGAWLLGKDVRQVVGYGPEPTVSLARLDVLLRPEIDTEGPLRLVTQMPFGDRERQLSLLTAFYAGLFETGISTT